MIPDTEFNPTLRYDLIAAAGFLRLSVSGLRARIAAGRVRPIKDGRRVFVAGEEIARLSRTPTEARTG